MNTSVESKDTSNVSGMDVDALQDDPLMLGGEKRDSFTLGNDPISFDDDVNMAGDSCWLDIFGSSDNLDLPRDSTDRTPRSSTEVPVDKVQGSTGGSSSGKKRPLEGGDGGPKDEARSFWDNCVSGRSQVYGGSTPTSATKKMRTKSESNNRMCAIFFGGK